jgi:nucleotide-binding universal stress UspA family protein
LVRDLHKWHGEQPLECHPMHLNKILHPTDYSEASRPALHTAADLAHESGATLVLLHVVETLGPERLSYGEAVAYPQPETYRQRLWEDLHRLRPRDPEIRVEYVLSEEAVVTAILRTAGDLGCDLIVLSTHGAVGWQSWFKSSTAEEVVRKANCNVLVVKTGKPAERLPEKEATDLHPGYLTERE